MKERHTQTLQNVILNKRQFLLGLAALIVGSLIYLIARPPNSTYFVNYIGIDTGLPNILPDVFGHISNNLPTFIHVFSFILLSASFIPSGKGNYLLISLSWFFVDCVFELGQEYNALFSKSIPAWFSGIPFLENTKAYFLCGTFDFYDLASISIGAVTAFLVLIFTMQGGCYGEKKSNSDW